MKCLKKGEKKEKCQKRRPKGEGVKKKESPSQNRRVSSYGLMVHGIINTIYKIILSWVENLAEDCEMSIALLKTKIQTLSVPPPLPIQGSLMTVALCVS